MQRCSTLALICAVHCKGDNTCSQKLEEVPNKNTKKKVSDHRKKKRAEPKPNTQQSVKMPGRTTRSEDTRAYLSCWARQLKKHKGQVVCFVFSISDTQHMTVSESFPHEGGFLIAFSHVEPAELIQRSFSG